MKLWKKILCVVLTVAIICGGTVALIYGGVFNKYEFYIDTTTGDNELPNVVNNVNIWSIEGNPFVDAKINEENNVFEFVEYVQFMQCSGGTEARDLFKDPADKTVLDDYDFSLLINNCRGIVDIGAKPFLKLGNVPSKFSKNATNDIGFGLNPYPPDDYDVYYDYIFNLAKALVKEFGVKEVSSWRFGVMTEYENRDWFFDGGSEPNPEKSAKAYCKLYDYTVAALQDAICEDIFVGAHSMTVTEGLWDEAEFIKHCAQGKNYKTGKTGSRICYLSASFYDFTSEDFTTGYTLPETIEYLRSTAESVGLNDLIYGIDEGRILNGTSSGSIGSELFTRTVGDTYQASYDARLIAQMFKNDIAYFSAWSYLSNGFFQGNPTVSYHVANLAEDFEGSKLLTTEKTKSGLMPKCEIDTVSAYNEETDTLRIMAYNFKNTVKYNNDVDLSFTVDAPQFYGKKVKVTQYVIDDDCNYFDEWVEDRKTYNITDDKFDWSPDDPAIDNTTTLHDEEMRQLYFDELFDKYTECSRLEPTTFDLDFEASTINLNTNLAPHGVVVYEITLAE